MAFLFGHLYTPSPVPSFTHDQKMFREKRDSRSHTRPVPVAEVTGSFKRPRQSEVGTGVPSPPKAPKFEVIASVSGGPDTQLRHEISHSNTGIISPRAVTKRRRLDTGERNSSTPPQRTPVAPEVDQSTAITPSRRHWSPEAYSAARREEIEDGLVHDDVSVWDSVWLVSVSGHQEKEVEL